MPYYEYRCASNGRTVEVRHAMSDRIDRWDELASQAGIDVGDTPGDAPVERLMSTSVPLTGKGEAPAFQGCGAGCACGPPSH